MTSSGELKAPKEIVADEKWILEPLTGITEDPKWDSAFVVPMGHGFTTLPPLRARLTDPPSYIVGLLLYGVAGFHRGHGDKSSWEVRLVYKGRRFRLWDYRRWSWSIGPVTSEVLDDEATDEFQKKISQAAQRLDTALQPVLRKKVEEGSFYVVNSSRQLRGGCEHFRDMLRRSLVDLEEWRRTPVPQTADDPNLAVTRGRGVTITESPLRNEHLSRQFRLAEAISYNALAALAFFFSYVELLMDALFAFLDRRSMSYTDFRKETWADRFKLVLPVASDKNLRTLYEGLLELKRVRDQVLHGLGGDPALLVPMGPIGLVPLSYKDLNEQVHYNFEPVDEQNATRILDLLDAFDVWIEANDASWFVQRWVDLQFEIPFEPGRVAMVKSWMTSREDYETALECEAQHLDYLQEQY